MENPNEIVRDLAILLREYFNGKIILPDDPVYRRAERYLVSLGAQAAIKRINTTPARHT